MSVLDSEIGALVTSLGAAPYIDLASLPLDRALAIARTARPVTDIAEPMATRDVTLRVADGVVMLRAYLPDLPGPLPIIVHLHGGGWVTGSVARDDGRCRAMARLAGAAVVSVGYRLSPEHPFPSPIDDAVAAWEWAMEHAPGLGADPDRTAISGASAGGLLAVAAQLVLRARGQPLPGFQLLTYPALDPDLASASYNRFADGPFMTRARMAWYWSQFLGAEENRDDMRSAPLKADLGGLSPAFVQVAECDVLRDDGVAYAERLRGFGVAAQVREYPGMIHGFIAVAPDHDVSRRAAEEAAAALRTHWQAGV